MNVWIILISALIIIIITFVIIYFSADIKIDWNQIPADYKNDYSNYVLKNSSDLLSKAKIEAYNNNDFKKSAEYLKKLSKNNKKLNSGEITVIDNLLNYIDDNGISFVFFNSDSYSSLSSNNNDEILYNDYLIPEEFDFPVQIIQQPDIIEIRETINNNIVNTGNNIKWIQDNQNVHDSVITDKIQNISNSAKNLSANSLSVRDILFQINVNPELVDKLVKIMKNSGIYSKTGKTEEEMLNEVYQRINSDVNNTEYEKTGKT